MNRLYRITSIILVFSLLASADIPILALESGEIERENHLHKSGPSFPHLELPPTWQPHTFTAPDLVGKAERAGPPIEPDLLRALIEAESGGNEYVRVVVYLREQADLDAATGEGLDAAGARARVVSTLQTRADQTQAPLRAYLEDARTAQHAAERRRQDRSQHAREDQPRP